jgi:hypothetical protein
VRVELFDPRIYGAFFRQKLPASRALRRQISARTGQERLTTAGKGFLQSAFTRTLRVGFSGLGALKAILRARVTRSELPVFLAVFVLVCLTLSPRLQADELVAKLVLF